MKVKKTILFFFKYYIIGIGMRRVMRNKIKYFFFSILTVIAISINKKMIYEKLLPNLDILKLSFIVMAILTIALYLFYKRYNKKIHPMKHILAIIFSLCYVIGNSYQEIASWDLVFSSVPLFLTSIIQIFCYYYLIKTILCFIDTFLERKVTFKFNTKNKIIKLFKEHPFLFSLIVILLFWLIYMIAFYPLILSKDPSFQIKQFFNVKTKYIDYVIPLSDKVNLTNHHPVFHTMLLGGSIKLGRLLGSDNLGLFIYAIMQSITLASSLAYTISYLYKKKESLILSFVLLMIYSLVPMFPFYAMSAVKDTLYTAIIIFFVITLFTIIDNNKEIKTSKYLVLLLLSILLYLLRNNGIYVAVGTILVLAIYRRKEFIYLIATLLFVIGTYISYDKILLPALKIPAGSIREELSVPFQQTARYVKEHGDEIPLKDRKKIDKLLEYDTLKDRYNPNLADPVKNKYNKYTTKKELKDYFRVWWKEFLIHPTTYIEATLNNTYGYFYPDTANWYIYSGKNYNKLITEDNLVNYHYNKLSTLRMILSGYGIIFPYIPLIGLISNIGFSAMGLITLIVYLLTSRYKKYVIAMLPSLLSLAICFISPANTYFRYTMPFTFLMPFYVSYVYLLLVKDN